MERRSKDFSTKDLVYKPRYALMLGSVTAAIFLKQVAFWSGIKHGEPFYKFNAPCSHKFYNEGDSWEEELGFSRSELDGARAKVGTKLTKDSGIHKADILMMDKAYFDDNGVMTNADRLVIYWTDKDRVTHYLLNEALLEDALAKHEKLMQKSCISDKRTKSRKPALPANAEKLHYPLTENTSENTNRNDLRANDARAEPPQAMLFDDILPDGTKQAPPPEKKPRQPDTYLDTIMLLWQVPATRAASIKQQLQGRVPTSKAHHHTNLNPPVELDEAIEFATKYYPRACKGCSLPKSPEKLQDHIEAMRREKGQQAADIKAGGTNIPGIGYQPIVGPEFDYYE